MIDPFAFVVISLAGWRLAYMVTNEDGPGDIFGWLRLRFAGPFGREVAPGSLDKLLGCVYCLSFWTTSAAALIWALDDTGARYVIFFIAAWGAATALDMVARRDG